MKEEKLITVPEEHLGSLEKRLADLRMLMDVSSIISSTLDFNELVSLVMEKAKEVMHAEACSILIMNRKTGKLEFEVALGTDDTQSEILTKHVTLNPGEGIAGWVAQSSEPVLVSDAARDCRFFGQADSLTGFTTRGMIAVPLIGRSGLIGVAEILNPIEKSCFSEYDLEIFQSLCRQVAVAMENAIFHKESIEREKLSQELELAATIQKSFLPELAVSVRGRISLSGITFPAKHVSGDLYDFVEPVPGKAGMIIGDISGKGVSAALFMAKAISEFRYLMIGIDDPGIVLGRLNRQLSNAPRGMFLTAVYAIADTQSGRVKVAVAGHPPFLWITKNGVQVMHPDAGPPIGIIDTEFPVTEHALEPGDRLLMLTDGVFDAKNSEGARLGFDEITEFVAGHRHAQQLPDMLAEFVNNFAGGADRADDLTVSELRYLA
jgi:sigma-B regulation protein RsbU (phosphoserine phosphatase)